jgi:UDPglucose 6-dehydrogenase
MKRLKAKGIEVIVYGTHLRSKRIFYSEVLDDLDEFKKRADLIVSNRLAENLNDMKTKVYTRSILWWRLSL